MLYSKKYRHNISDGFPTGSPHRYVFTLSFILYLLCLLLLIPLETFADNRPDHNEKNPITTYDELPVEVYIGADFTFNVNVIITNTDTLYVNAIELFKKLVIPCTISNNGSKMNGFIGDENNPYEIDLKTNKIKIGDNTVSAHNGLLAELGDIYVESSLLAETFGIILTFNPRSLYLDLTTNMELPIFKQQRQEEARKNIAKLQDQEIPADTIIKRDYHLFKFGTLDWGISSTQSKNYPVNNFVRLGLGAELLYGEAMFSIYHNNLYEFDRRQINYLWRYVDNDNRFIRQASVGKIPTLSIAFLGSPVVGASLTNSPTTLRKASGYYTINDHTEPNWTVELYLNDQLVDFTTADASGLYVFKVPIVYGYTTLKLKFYGPMGEVRSEERSINLPYAMLPAKELEYTVSGGFLQDSSSSRYGKAELNYGVSRILTVAGGLEYLSSISTGEFIPYAKATLQPFSKLTLNAEYAHGVRLKGRLSYYFLKNALLEFKYTKNVDGQQATIFYANEERWGSLYIPFKIKKLSGYAKFDHIQLIYSEFNYNQSNLMFSLYYKQFSANNSTHFNWNSGANLYVTNDLALSLNIKGGYVVRTLAQYNVSGRRLMTAKIELEKRIKKIFLSASYQRNIISQKNYITLSFRYDLPFARTAVSAFYSDDNISLSEGAQGSLAFGGDNNYIKAGNNTSVGRGGILFYPFLDLNQNGVFDKNEKMVKISSVKLTGGRPTISEKDSIVRIADLNAFVYYDVEFTDNDLDNIAWRFTNKKYQVIVDPNQFKRVDVPIVVMGEATGMVYMQNGDETKGIGRITIQIYDKQGNKVAETLSESDGYLNYLGLKPGDYLMCLDSNQLNTLNLSVKPLCREFTVKTLQDGDIVTKLEFILQKKESVDATLQSSNYSGNSNPLNTAIHKEEKVSTDLASQDQFASPELELPLESNNMSKPEDRQSFRVQLLATKKPIDKEVYFASLLTRLPGINIIETKGNDDYYRYSSIAIGDRNEALSLMKQITNAGWPDSFISSVK